MCGLILVLLLGAAAAYVYSLFTKRAARKIVLEANIERRRRERDESVAAAEAAGLKLDQATRERIGQMNFQQLRAELQNGTVSCLDAVRTYMWKGVQAHRKTNCVTQFIKEAEENARAWDEKAKDPQFVKPPLFGIPVSVKECIPYGGYDTSRGFAQDLFKPAKEDSVMVEQLKKLGLVPFCFTNVPQSLLTYNSCNPIYGTTNHPLDPKRTSGGSTGGESALIAADGSILGIGGDVGGSIRMPCHFTGIAGIKASHLRFAHRGNPGAIPGRPLINANDGPMCKDIKTNVDFLREVWKDTWLSEQDAYVPPVVWNEDMYSSKKPLKVGYYVDDGWFQPIPAVQRAILEAKTHLEAAGHTLVPFKPPRIPRMFHLYVRALSVDGGRFLRDRLLADIIHPTLYAQVLIYLVPIWVQRLISIPAQFFFPRLANILTSMTLSTKELRETYAEIEAYRTEFTEMMRTQGIDALLCPPQVMIAPEHDIPCKLFSCCTYTTLFNLLDYGAGVVNVTKVTKEDDQKLLDEYPESDPWYKLAKKACLNSVGFPVGVQVAVPPFREESALRLLRDIEIAVTGH